MRNMGRSIVLPAMAGVVGLNTGCAVFDPYVSADGISSAQGYEAVKAKAYAIADRMQDSTNELELYDLATGLVILGAGIAGMSFAAFDVSRDSVVAAGIVGGSAGALRIFFPFAQRQQAYLRGAAAIQCAVTATSFGPDPGAQPGVTSTPGLASAGMAPALTLSQRLNSVKAGLIADLPVPQRSANSVGPTPPGPSAPSSRVSPSMAQAAPRVASVANARLVAIEQAGQRAIDAIDAAQAELTRIAITRADALEVAVRAVIVAVNEQISNSRVDPDGALQAAAEKIEAAQAPFRDKAQQLTEVEDNLEQTADETDGVASVLAASGAAPGADPALAQEATRMEDKADVARQKAAEIGQIAAEMLRIVNQSTACFRGLVTEASSMP